MRTISTAVIEDAVRALDGTGYYVIDDFLPRHDCDGLCAAIDNYIKQHPENISGNTRTDDRIFAAEYVSDPIRDYKYHAGIKAIGSSYLGTEQDVLFSMANRIIAKTDVSIRSGGRWHRDRRTRQFKSMLYLSDVGAENGPFSLLPESSMTAEKYDSAARKTGFDYSDQRWSDTDISPFLKMVGQNLKIFTAVRGTLIMFDSSLIHSGQKIKSGSRYALTNYFYDRKEISIQKSRKKWAVSAGPIGF